MVDNSLQDKLTAYLRRLGLAREEAILYVALTKLGTSTPLQLSRTAGINRTKVYRTLEGMAQKKLVLSEIDEHSTRVTAAPLEHLEEIVRRKQRNIAQIAQDYPEMMRILAGLGAEQGADTKVRFYRGKSGLEQMIWNVLKAESEIVGYTTRDLSDFVGEKFMDEFAAEFIRRNLTMRDIYGSGYVKSAQKMYDWQGHIQSHRIPDTILTLPHQMDIYNDVVTFYSWHEKEVFGVEIYNAKIATHQKQLFELAWEKARTVSS